MNDIITVTLTLASGVFMLAAIGCLIAAKAYEAGFNDAKKQAKQGREPVLSPFRHDTVESLN